VSEQEITSKPLAPGEGLRLALACALALFVLGGRLIGGSGARIGNQAGINEAPRPEADVSGRPPRGGHRRAVAPVGGVEVNPSEAPPDRSAEATPNSPSEDRSPQEHPEDARRIARSSSGHTARGRGFKT
jgi:hypothetical protein